MNARAGLTPEERAEMLARWSLCPTHQQRLQVAETCPMCAWLEANTNQKLLAVEAERDALQKENARLSARCTELGDF